MGVDGRMGSSHGEQRRRVDALLACLRCRRSARDGLSKAVDACWQAGRWAAWAMRAGVEGRIVERATLEGTGVR